MRMLLFVIAACSAPAKQQPIVPSPEPDYVEAKPVEAEAVQAAPINNDDAKRAATEFLALVRASSAAITGCWNSAQSANPELRTREIPLSITAEFDPTGLVKLSLSPMVTESFAECVNQRTTGWKVAVTQKMTFKASLNLKP